MTDFAINLPRNPIDIVLATELQLAENATVMLPARDTTILSDIVSADNAAISAMLGQTPFTEKDATSVSYMPLQGDKVAKVVLFQLANALTESKAVMFASAEAAAKALFSAAASEGVIDIRQLDAASDWLARFVQILVIKATKLYVHKAQKEKTQLKKLIVLANDAQRVWAEEAIAHGVALGDGINLTRQLGDLPGNICTPSFLAQKAQELGQHFDFEVDIKGGDEIQALGMGSFWGVAKGSVEDPKLITMSYKGGQDGEAPIVFVGKGLTFDSGGISIKPSAGMDEMKYDMGGSAAVFGAISAISALKLPINVMGIIGSCENMPDAAATKPGDVLTSMSGKTIEVLNTDAEGRLVLCDVLTYAQQFNPKSIVDIATLTGAIIVALGKPASGLFSNDDALAQELEAAANDVHDRVWRFPIWEDYQKQLKSNFADLANIGGREAGSITAACFLANFTESVNWAHVDIAATAWNSGANKGATGRPVNMLVEYVRRQAS